MMSQLIQSIQDFICHNQKQTIKYEYLISERHKIVKDCYNDSSCDKDELNKLYNMLIIDSYNDLFKVFESNKTYIHNIFHALGKNQPPRITIKTLHGDSVLDIYRSTYPTDFNSTNIKDNTGFSNILNKNKLYFLDNDLPKSFIENKYSNPRLVKEKLSEYLNESITWKECWKSLNHNEEQEYYSSTLILPMSIRGTNDDEKDINFYNHFFKEIQQHKDSRTIWGFLCFDSIDINYFNNTQEDDFASIGYIMSDILSLYLMYFYNHISGSKTIKLVEEKLY
jgi:hypothetical protein